MTENEALEDIIKSGINLGAGDYVDPEALEVAAKALQEIQQYRSIGTVEECREAVEKQKARKPTKYDNCGNKCISRRCPNCFEIISGKHCEHCGQHMDKSDKVFE